MKKKILIVCLLLILTGCKANYTLTIKDGKIKEEFEVIEDDIELANKKDKNDKSFYDYSSHYGNNSKINVNYYGLYSQEECNSNCEYYKNEFINTEDEVGFKLSHEFDFENYSNSSIATEVIPSFSSSYDGRYLTISGDPSWDFTEQYNNLEEITIRINTNYKVISTNLIKVENDVYKWTIKDENTRLSQRLYITLDTNEIINTSFEDSNDILIFIIIGVAGLTVALIYLKFYKDKI